MTNRTDTELVQTARSGDKRALEELIGRHQQMVHRLAARMVTDQAVAQELAQEALLQAYLCLHDLRNPGSFQSWLYGIVLNLCRRYRQSRHEDYLSFDALRVEALRENTFYAIAKLLSHGQVAEIDARPSDAIALAQHMGSPIYVHEEVMASAGMEAPEQFQKQTKPRGLQAVAEELAQKMREWEPARKAATEHSAEQHEQARRALLDYLAGEHT